LQESFFEHKSIMKYRFTAVFLGLLMLGFCFGLLMLGVAHDLPLYDKIRNYWDAINKPAFIFADIWSHKLHLPPQNDIAFATVPVFFVMFQWTLVGGIFGFLIGRLKCKGKRGNSIKL